MRWVHKQNIAFLLAVLLPLSHRDRLIRCLISDSNTSAAAVIEVVIEEIRAKNLCFDR